MYINVLAMYRKQRRCVTAKLICIFVFAYAKSRFSHDEAQIVSVLELFCMHIIEDTGWRICSIVFLLTPMNIS